MAADDMLLELCPIDFHLVANYTTHLSTFIGRVVVHDVFNENVFRLKLLITVWALEVKSGFEIVFVAS